MNNQLTTREQKALTLTDDLTNELMDRLVRTYLEDGIESNEDDDTYGLVWNRVSCLIHSIREEFDFTASL